jgi:ribosome-binding protein aMBF1 (putative translation factor)
MIRAGAAGAVVASAEVGGHVGSSGRRSHTTNEQNVTRFRATRHLHVVKDELAPEGQPLLGGAMSLARDECSDDRPPLVEGPGLRLRRQREARSLTIGDLARTTKINKTILAAIETSDVQRLPATIYTRGFVKAYAREVGLDPEKAADDYLAGITPIAAHSPVDHAGYRPPVARPANVLGPAHSEDGVDVDNSMGQFGWVTTIVAGIGLIAYLGYLGSVSDDIRQDARAIRAEQPAVSDATPAVQDDRLTADATNAVGGPLRLELRTQGLCWIVVSVDGEPVLARLLQAGEHHSFAVESEAVMRVGDPGAVTMSINGRTGRPLGAPGEPVDLTITRSNFREFLP